MNIYWVQVNGDEQFLIIEEDEEKAKQGISEHYDFDSVDELKIIDFYPFEPGFIFNL